MYTIQLRTACQRNDQVLRRGGFLPKEGGLRDFGSEVRRFVGQEAQITSSKIKLSDDSK